MQFAVWDYLLMVVYILLMAGAAVYAKRRGQESLEDYFTGGKDLPWWLIGISMVATTFAADTPSDELSLLCDLWAISMTSSPDSGQTFTTRCWEANFNSIRVVSLHNFIEYLDDQAERNLDLAGCAHGAAHDTTLDAHPHCKRRPVQMALAGRVDDADLVTQVQRRLLGRIGRDGQGRGALPDADAWAFEFRRL